MSFLVLAGIISVLILFNGLYVAAEFALLAVQRTQLEQRAGREPWAARMLAVLHDSARQDHYIAVAQVGITLASLGLGMYSEHALAGLFLPYLQTLPLGEVAAHGLATGFSLILLTYLHIVLGEMVPKSLALMQSLATARFVELPMRLSAFLLGPMVWALNSTGNLILRLLRLPISQDLSLVYSPEELRLVFTESREGGALAPEQHEWLQSLLGLRERTVRQVMVARTRVVGLAVESTVREGLERVREEGYTRYPLFERDMDHLVGVVHVRDLFGAMRRGQREFPLRDLMRACPYLPESLHLDQALDRMRAEQAHLAVVVDEHGGTAGIVTLEDLVEEVFGEVFDEFDDDESPSVGELAPGEWTVQGDVLLEDLSETVGRPLLREGVETVSGLLLDLLERPPEVGDKVDWQGATFEVWEVADMVAAFCLVRLQPEPEAETPTA